MKNNKSSGWNKSWVVGAIAIVIVAVGAVQMWKFAHPPPDPEGPLDRMARAMASDPTSMALTKQAAEEAARLLGGAKGKVALVLPSIKELHDMSHGGAYEAGFREGLKANPSIKLAGIYFASPPCLSNQHTDCSIPTLERLQDIRAQYPKVDMIVSLLGLPQLSAAEQATWLALNPPKMVVVELSPLKDRDAAKKALEAGLAEVVIVNTAPYQPPEALLAGPGETLPAMPTPQFDVIRRP